MKLLFCERCKGLVVPEPVEYKPRGCRCENASCYWRRGSDGDILFVIEAEHGVGSVAVIGINNHLLLTKVPEDGCVSGEEMFEMHQRCGHEYLFFQKCSNVVKFRPGSTSDTEFVG